jgi:hypothetical protein
MTGEIKEEETFDVTTLTGGEEVHYLNRDKGEFLVDQGTVKGENLYKDGVTVYGEGWKQYVGKWFIVKVVKDGKVLFIKEELFDEQESN